jgi:hypothetical protein
MITKFQLLSVLLIFSLAACAPAATEPVTTEPVLTEAPVEPQTEQPEEPATEAPTEPSEEETNYFVGFPPEYQDITLPPQIIAVLQEGGSVVPLPDPSIPFADELSSFATSVSADITPYDLGRVVAFTSDQEYTYVAVPISSEYFAGNFDNSFEDGEPVGFLYDQNGAYGNAPEVYEVWFFDDSAILLSSQREEVILTTENEEFFWTQQEIFKEIPVAVFVEGSCYLCWSLDSRSGCLICT